MREQMATTRLQRLRNTDPIFFDHVIEAIKEEIGKVLLTDEEIRFLRDAANIQESKLLLGDTTILCERAVAQAQLQKILKALAV